MPTAVLQTNFDPAHAPEGVPNFVDIPEEMMVVRPPTIQATVVRRPAGVPSGA